MAVKMDLARRRLLAGGLGVLALGAATAHATPDQAKQLLRDLAKGEPREGRVTIKAPEIAENGNSVPVSVTVDSPMTDSDYVKAIHVVADGNPNPGVVSMALSPASGRAQVEFRVRMAQTQKVIAVAEMSDGSLFMASREVKVTLGGCGG